MLKDIGFWNEQGEYIADIQEVSEVEMDKEIIIDGELSCNNCLEKTRCKQQQEAKKQRIDAILSYIANEDNEKYIAELKNKIPAITRCDVVLEKQLKRLEQENAELKAYKDVNEDFKTAWEELKAENERLKALCDTYRTCYQAKHSDIKCLLPKYRTTLQEIKAIVKKNISYQDTDSTTKAMTKILDLITKAEEE